MTMPRYDSRFAPGGYAPPPPPPPAPKRTSMRLVGLAVGAVAVVALAVVVALALTLGAAPKPGPSSQSKPVDAALAFMEAVASGDASAALALQVHQPADRTFLTKEALTESRKLAPITEITPGSQSEQVAEVSFKVGGETKRGLFRPVRQPDGTYKIERGTTVVQVTRRKGLPVLLGGIEMKSGEAEIFPGAHSITTGLRNITYAESQFTVADSQSFPRIAPAPRITEEGRTAFVNAAKAQLEACLQVKQLTPPDCPQVVKPSEGQKPELDTIRWKLEGPNPLDNLQPRISAADETQAEAQTSMRINVSVMVSQNGVRGESANTFTFGSTAVAKMTTDDVLVRFTRAA
ncbi:hypothetical protein GCM10027418_26910 [Mariniluteicoccus endophyticus]